MTIDELSAVLDEARKRVGGDAEVSVYIQSEGISRMAESAEVDEDGDVWITTAYR